MIQHNTIQMQLARDSTVMKTHNTPHMILNNQQLTNTQN